jgi:aryl-alcohol dehydrogenase-like predicted oxidoreductase
MIPIPGMSRVESLEDSARAADIALTSKQMDKLNAAVT